MKMNSFTRLVALVFAGTIPAISRAASPAAVAPRPNIVYIMADDLGYGEVSCFGQQHFATPNIDRLATEGIRLTSHYAGDTVCSPSRCALMTGRHSGHGRIRSNFGVGPAGEPIRVSLTPADRTVAHLLRSVGYATACIGKWGLGEEGTEGVPWRQGFEHFYGFLNDAHAHNQYPEFLYNNAEKIALVSNYSHEHGQFADDLFTADALRFLAAQRRDRPFFLYLALTSPHAELTPPQDVLAATRRQYPALSAPGVDPSAVLFAAMVVRLDQHVGAIMACLADLGLAHDTLVIFTSDNGPHREDGKDNAFFKATGPLRGIKRDLYEGGIRAPFIARWPGHIKPSTTSTAPSAFWDFLPTVAELAGFPVPPDADGVSYVPALLGQTAAKHPPFYWEFVYRDKPRQAVRLGDWKAVRNGLSSPLELFNLADDLEEQHDVARAHPDVAMHLEKIMQQEHTEDALFPLSPPKGRVLRNKKTDSEEPTAPKSTRPASERASSDQPKSQP